MMITWFVHTVYYCFAEVRGVAPPPLSEQRGILRVNLVVLSRPARYIQGNTSTSGGSTITLNGEEFYYDQIPQVNRVRRTTSEKLAEHHPE